MHDPCDLSCEHLDVEGLVPRCCKTGQTFPHKQTCPYYDLKELDEITQRDRDLIYQCAIKRSDEIVRKALANESECAQCLRKTKVIENLLEQFSKVSHECAVLTTYLVNRHPETREEITREYGIDFEDVKQAIENGIKNLEARKQK